MGAGSARAAESTGGADFPIRDLLRDTVPTAFAPADLEAADFHLQVVSGSLPPGAQVEMVPESLQWVRVAEVLTLPRARFRVRNTGTEDLQGLAEQGGFAQGFELKGASRAATILFAPFPGKAGAFKLVFARGGQKQEVVLQTRFEPSQPERANLALFDPSCSPYQLERISAQKGPGAGKTAGWTLFGCRFQHVEGDAGRSSLLEVLVFRSNESGHLKRGDLELPGVGASTWALRLSPEPGEFQLADEVSTDRFRYSIPSPLHLASIGFGLGPYGSSYDAPGTHFAGPAPVGTLYGSYFLTEQSRMVSFGLAPLRGPFNMDIGLYLHNESFRVLDRRISFSLMLGAHALWFLSNGASTFKFGLPQGFELVYRDFLKPRMNASVGAFVYPFISGRSYYNAWVRWGSPSFFGEFNYIQWQETVGDDIAFSRNIGLSFGMPLYRFF